MSDEFTPALGGISAEDLSEAINTSSPKFLDGITDSIASSEESLLQIRSDLADTGWFGDILNEMLLLNKDSSEKNTIASEEINSFLESIKTMQEDMLGYTVLKENDDKKLKNKKTKTTSLRIDDLKELPNDLGLGFALLSSQLAARDAKDAKDKKGGLAGFFQGLLEGVGGIASLGVALLAFAGATLIFNFVDWGDALFGLVAFTAFTIGMVTLAKLLGKEQQANLRDFAVSSLLLSASLGVFSLSLLIASAVWSGDPIFGMKIKIGAALKAVGVFSIFILAMAGIAMFMSALGGGGSSLSPSGEVTGSSPFAELAKASFMLAASLGVFSFAMWIASSIFGEGIKVPFTSTLIKVDPVGSILALGFFTTFLLAMAGISVLASVNKGNFKQFAQTTMILSGSLVLFGFTLFLTAGIVKGRFGDKQIGFELTFDANSAFLGVILFAGFIASMAGISILANKNKSNFTEFAVTSLILSAALVVFAFGVSMVGKIISGGLIKAQGTEVTVPPFVAALGGLVLFGLFVAGFAVLGTAFGTAMPGILMMSAASVLMSFSLLVFAGALSLTILAVSGGIMLINNKQYDFGPKENRMVNALKAIGFMTVFIAAFAAIGLASQILLPLIGIASLAAVGVALSVIAVGRSMALASILGRGEASTFFYDGKRYELPAISVESIMNGFKSIGKFITGFTSLNFKELLKGAAMALMIGPVVNAMDMIFNVMAKALTLEASVKQKTGKNLSDINIDGIFDPVIIMIGSLSDVSLNLGIKGAKAFKIVSESLMPIVQSMGMLTDIVEKAAYLKGKNDEPVEVMLVKANKNLTMIMLGVPGNENSGFVSLFNNIAIWTVGIRKASALAMESFPPVVQALSGLTDIVLKASTIKEEQISLGIKGLNLIVGFVDTLLSALKTMIPGGVAGFFKKAFTGDPSKVLQDAHKILGESGDYHTVLNDLIFIGGLLTPEQFEKVSNIQLLGQFGAEFIAGTKSFSDGLKNISDGVKRYTTSNIDGLERIATSMERMSVLDVSKSIDPIVALAAERNNLKDTATYMKQIADSFEKMTKKKSMSERMSDAVGTLKDTAKSLFGLGQESMATQTGAASASAPITIRPGDELAGIAQIMEKWDAEGVKIHGGIESKEQKPVPVRMLQV